MKKRKQVRVQPNFHVKKNDLVVVLSGSERGKRGKILQVIRNRNRVLIEGVNLRKKAQKKNQEGQGGIIEREGPLPISNVMIAERYDARSGAKKAGNEKAEKAPATKASKK